MVYEHHRGPTLGLCGHPTPDHHHGRGPGSRLVTDEYPYLLGTLFTPDHNRALVIGFTLHFASGWVFALFYALVFETLCRASWLLGGGIGLLQALVVLVTLMPIAPSLHPRMASEHRGPEPTRALEPPGFLALNYGRRTPLVTIAAHVVYGALLGALYRPLCG